MKSRNVYVAGQSISTLVDYTPPGSIKTQVTTLNSGRDYLGVTTDTKNGNRKSPNPHQFTITKESYWQGVRTIDDRYNNRTTRQSGVLGSYAASGNVDSHLATMAYNRCLSDFYDKLRGTLDLSVDIAQSGQVVRMLRQAADFRKHIIRTGTFLRRLDKDTEQSYVKRVGGQYLEWVYGWKPLASSIHSTIGNLAQTAENMMHIEAQASERSLSKYTGPVPFGKALGEVQQSARCRMLAEFRPPSGTIQDIARYTSLNPMSIAWELVPYSFVVDWFVDLGSYLRGMETAMVYSNRFMSGYMTTGTTMTVSATCTQAESSLYQTVTGYGSSTQYRATKSRSIMNGAPYPKRPTFQADLGSSRLLAAAALLSQGFTTMTKVPNKR